MSGGGKGKRGAAAGFGLAALGMIYSRLGGRVEEAEPERGAAPRETADAPVSSEDVDRARAELADELARRSQR